MSELVPGRRRDDHFGRVDDDEISLVDLFRVLMVSKWLIILVAIAITTMAVLYAFSRPTLYEYSVNIDIGSIGSSTASGVKRELFDTPENTKVNLVNGYIPMVLANYRRNFPEDVTSYQITASIYKGSSIIQLKAMGTIAQEARYHQLMNEVVSVLMLAHAKKISTARSVMERDYKLAKLTFSKLEDVNTLTVQDLKLEKALLLATTKLESLQDPRFVGVSIREIEKQVVMTKQRLSSLKEQETLFKAQDQRLEQTKDLLVKQVNELDAQVAMALQRQQTSLSGLDKQQGNEAKAMTLLMIDNEIQKNRNRLASLDERLYISLENQREKLANELSSNIRAQFIQQQDILAAERKLEQFFIKNEIKIKLLKPEVELLAAQLKMQRTDQQRAIARQGETVRELGHRIEGIQPTRTVTDIVTSWQPVGTGKRVIVMLGAVLGLMAGVFLAFALEFLRKMRMEDTQAVINEPATAVAVQGIHPVNKSNRLHHAKSADKPLQEELA